jgi:diacylglycerol kinase family enzyme
VRHRRLAAVASLVLFGASVVLAVVVAVERFPRGLSVLACVVVAAAAAWWALVRRGSARVAGALVAAVFLVGAVVLVVLEGWVLEDALILAGLMVSVAAASRAFVVRAQLPAASAPSRPVLFYNPKSGGGKAERFHVADEARARGVEPVELHLGDDLGALVRDAIAGGADAVGVAGGDGTQAIVAAIAAEQGLPYVCVPAGTRNHFALDLGVDRDDVVGALDAFTKGRERVVDLAEVNGRVFVNNVSLGVYAEAVQSAGYRDAKLRTLADTVPTVLGPGGEGLDLRFTGADGQDHSTGAVVMVSNNPYRLGRMLGSGTRPRLDAGALGITVAGEDAAGGEKKRVEEWSAPSFEVRSANSVAAGIDGEAAKLDPPLRFRTRPRALRVRIAPQHPGASPSAAMPEGPWDAISAIVGIAIHGSPRFTTAGPEPDTPADRGIPPDSGSPADEATAASPGTPAAIASAQPTSDAKPTSRRVHRFLVPGLLVLATVIGIAATFAIWVNRQALNTSNWSSTSSKILEDKQVQTALSAYLVHQLFANVDVSAELQTVLPKQLQPLSGPAAAGLQQLAGQLAPRLLASSAVQGAWVQANIAAHKELLRVLNGGGPVVSTRSGVVSLNLRTLVSQLAATVGLSSQLAAVRSKLQGSTGATVRTAAQAKLGVTLPPASGQLVIMRSNQLKTAQDIANAVKHLAVVLPALAIGLFALAVYLARGRRRRTLRTTGWCFVLIGAALLLIRRVAGDAVVDGLVKIPSNKPAVHQVWNIGTSLLRDIAVAMIAYGFVIVASAWLAGPTRPATEIRKALAPKLRDSPAVAYSTVGGVLVLLVLIGPTPAFRNIVWVLVFAVLLAYGVTMLRRQTAVEFAGIQHGQALRDLRDQRAQAHARKTAHRSPPADATIAASAERSTVPAATSGRVEMLERLGALRASGVITDEELAAEKAHLMNNDT